MSSDTVITVEDLGKRYRIKHQAERQRYATLRDVLADKTKGVARRLWSLARPSTLNSQLSTGHKVEDFWALKDVSFEVKQGETLGIIGRNGAGKSTLLKILSRITEPTEGRVRIKGRIASLLEVGTGFHPELTGRENIFLNGAILGMTRVEIKKKFDEIVAFSEVDKFLDTPVKRYSSGMYVRLAFAVAAHLEPEILIVDEVLAVGDAQFQSKCLGKMGEVARGGRAVLFVSHNMSAIARLCHRAALLEKGRLTRDGAVAPIVQTYLSSSASATKTDVDLADFQPRFGNRNARILRARVVDANKQTCGTFTVGDCIIVQFLVDYVDEDPASLTHCVEVSNGDGLPILHLWDVDSLPEPRPSNRCCWVAAKLTEVNLFPDRFVVSLWIGDSVGKATEDYVPSCLSFEIVQDNSKIPRPLSKSKGLIWRVAEWSYRAECASQ